MPINGIDTQRVADVSLNNVQENSAESPIHDFMEKISEASKKSVTPAGPSVTECDSAGRDFSFTPYYSNTGDKLAYIEIRSPSGIVSHMSLKQEQLDNYCSRHKISIPTLQYN